MKDLSLDEKKKILLFYSVESWRVSITKNKTELITELVIIANENEMKTKQYLLILFLYLSFVISVTNLITELNNWIYN